MTCFIIDFNGNTLAATFQKEIRKAFILVNIVEVILSIEVSGFLSTERI